MVWPYINFISLFTHKLNMENADVNALTDDQKKTMIQALLNEEKTLKEIGLYFNKNGTTIGRWVDKWGLVNPNAKPRNNKKKVQQKPHNANKKNNAPVKVDPPEDKPIDTAPIEFDESDIDESFRKMMKYKAYASKMGEDIDYRTIQKHLDVTDQLKKSKEEFETDEEFLQGIQQYFTFIDFTKINTIHERKLKLVEEGVITNEHL